jgi:hypothetical protein
LADPEGISPRGVRRIGPCLWSRGSRGAVPAPLVISPGVLDQMLRLTQVTRIRSQFALQTGPSMVPVGVPSGSGQPPRTAAEETLFRRILRLDVCSQNNSLSKQRYLPSIDDLI